MNYPLPDENNYTIYSKNGCHYCVKAKQLLEHKEPVIIDCDEYLKNNKQDFLSFIKCISNNTEHNTFPIVFYCGKYIGGYNDTKEYFERNDIFENL